MSKNKANNPNGINQYTGHAKAQATKITRSAAYALDRLFGGGTKTVETMSVTGGPSSAKVVRNRPVSGRLGIPAKTSIKDEAKKAARAVARETAATESRRRADIHTANANSLATSAQANARNAQIAARTSEGLSRLSRTQGLMGRIIGNDTYFARRAQAHAKRAQTLAGVAVVQAKASKASASAARARTASANSLMGRKTR